jgi:hypothetical protein
MAGQLQPYFRVDHRPEFGWRWTGHGGYDSLISWGHGFLTKRMAEEAGDRWVADQKAKAKEAAREARRAARKKARGTATNGKGTRGNARKS